MCNITKKNIGILWLSLLMLMGSAGQAQELRTPEDALEFSNRIIMDISRVRFDEAWRKMRENASIPADRIEAFAREYDSHFVRTIQHFGPSVGVELISRDMAGKSMLRVTYLVKYEVTGVAWFMYFYRLNDRWMLSEFNYDINSNAVFAAAGLRDDSSNNDLVWAVWRDEIEQRLTALEARPVDAVPAVMPVSQPVDDGARSTSQEGDNSGMVEVLENRLLDIEKRLAANEQYMGGLAQEIKAVDAAREEPVKDIVLGGAEDLVLQIEWIKATLALLRKHHPYTEFPAEP
ncbi:MAG: hypothetical protein WC997_05810 [Porticoccaceae bacterium]